MRVYLSRRPSAPGGHRARRCAPSASGSWRANAAPDNTLHRL